MLGVRHSLLVIFSLLSMIFGNFSNSGERLELDVVFRNVFEYLINLFRIKSSQKKKKSPKLGAAEL